jgi:hypothetical protein
VTDLFERLVAASGLPAIRLHDLRHGAATLMLAADIDIKIVSDTLGHSDTRITRDIYQSVLPQVGRSAAEATAKLVPLQRKAEAEKAARKAAKAAKKAGKGSGGKPKAIRTLTPRPRRRPNGRSPKSRSPERLRSRIAHAGTSAASPLCGSACPGHEKTPGHGE